MQAKALLIFGAVALLMQTTLITAADYGCPKSGKTYKNVKATAYYPSNDGVEGGYVDCRDKKLKTLQGFLDGDDDYVSVAMDKNLNIKYGTEICIPEINKRYEKNIIFKVTDTGSDFTGKEFTRIDICVKDEDSSKDDAVNGKLTLVFPNLKKGDPSCS